MVDLRIAFLSEFQHIPEAKEEMNAFRLALQSFFQTKMTNGEFASWLAENENEVIATSGLSFLQRPPHFHNPTGRFAYIMSMYTKPSWRRKGIGSALLEKLLVEVKHMGIHHVVLHATPIGGFLYEKYGFKEKIDDKEMVLTF